MEGLRGQDTLSLPHLNNYPRVRAEIAQRTDGIKQTVLMSGIKRLHCYGFRAHTAGSRKNNRQRCRGDRSQAYKDGDPLHLATPILYCCGAELNIFAQAKACATKKG